VDNEQRTGIQISNNPAHQEVTVTRSGVTINASEKPIIANFIANWGNIYILLDCSGSMKGSKLDQAKKGILDFAKDAFKKNYRVGLVKFSDNAEHLCEPTNDINILQSKLQGLRADGWTNLTAAMIIAHSKLKDFSGIKVMVIATDGMPDSVRSSLKEAEKAKADGIAIITIGTDDADKKYLQKLASRNELSAKVDSNLFAQTISAASLLLTSPKEIKPR
jgi:Mg-chelatase subunit ChlD